MPEVLPRSFSASEKRHAAKFAEALPASDRAEFLERLAAAIANQPPHMPNVFFKLAARRIWREMQKADAE